MLDYINMSCHIDVTLSTTKISYYHIYTFLSHFFAWIIATAELTRKGGF